MNYSNTGALFTNNYKKHEKAPDFKGDITLERALVKQLLADSEDDVKIRISGWSREGRNGKFISLAYDSYKPQESESRPKIEPKSQIEQKRKPDPIDEEEIPF